MNGGPWTTEISRMRTVQLEISRILGARFAVPARLWPGCPRCAVACGAAAPRPWGAAAAGRGPGPLGALGALA